MPEVFRGDGARRRGAKLAEVTFCLLLLAAAAWVALSPVDFKREEARPDFKVTLSEASSSVSASAPRATLKGLTTMPARARVLVNNIPYGESGEGSSFSFDDLPLRLGPNRVEVQATAGAPGPVFLWWPTRLLLSATPAGKEVPGEVSAPTPSPTPAPTPAAATATASATPTPTPTPSPFGRRSLTARLSYRRLAIDVEVSLPNEDPRVVDLAERRIVLREFVQRTFSKFFVNGRTLDHLFTGVRPTKIVTADRFTTVKASSNRRLEDFSPGKDGLIEFSPGWRPTENADDSFTLRVADYEMDGLSPPPSLRDDGGATWTGSRAELLATPDEMKKGDTRRKAVRVNVTRSALEDPYVIFRQLRLTPYDVFHVGLYPLVAFALSVLAAVPSIWVLGILSRPHGVRGKDKKDEDEDEDDVRRPYAWPQRFARYLIALAFVPPVLYAAYRMAPPDFLASAFESYHLSGGDGNAPAQDDLRSLVLPVLLVWLAALAARAVASLWARRGAPFWAWAAFRGVADAAAVVLLMKVALAAVMWRLPSNVVGLYERAALALNLLGVAPALALACVAAYKHADELRLPGGRVLRALLPVNKPLRALLLAAAAAAALFGLSSLASPAAAAAADARGVVSTDILNSVRDFFSLLRDALPYALLLAVALLLAREDGGGGGAAAAGPFVRFGVGKALFVAYVVGSSANLFLLPVPMLLALWLYDRCVMHDASEQGWLDSFKPAVFDDDGLLRKGLLKEVLKVPTMKDYEGVVELYGEKLAAREIALSDYDAKMEEIREHVSGQKKEVDSGGGKRDAKELVLGLGLYKENGSNGRWALWRGMLLAVPFAFVFAWELLQGSAEKGAPAYPVLRVASPALVFIAYWGVSGYFFGHFAAYIRGRTCLKKAGRVAAAVVACLLPIWVVSLGSPIALLLRVAQTVLFFTALGAWMDYRIFRRSLDGGFSLKKLIQFEEAPALTTAGSALLASIGGLVTSSLTDQLGTLTTQIVSMAFQQSPPIIPGG